MQTQASFSKTFSSADNAEKMQSLRKRTSFIRKTIPMFTFCFITLMTTLIEYLPHSQIGILLYPLSNSSNFNNCLEPINSSSSSNSRSRRNCSNFSSRPKYCGMIQCSQYLLSLTGHRMMFTLHITYTPTLPIDWIARLRLVIAPLILLALWPLSAPAPPLVLPALPALPALLALLALSSSLALLSPLAAWHPLCKER